jgi:hypothetical protein
MVKISQIKLLPESNTNTFPQHVPSTRSLNMASPQSQYTPSPTNPAFIPEPDITVEDDGIVEQLNSAQNNDNNNNEQNSHTRRQLRGAAVAGGLTGFLLGGPIIAAVVAGGAALAVTTSKGQAGNVARSTGEVVASAGDRLKRVDQKHHVVDKTAKGFTKSCNWVAKKMKPRDQQPPTTTTPAQVF